MTLHIGQLHPITLYSTVCWVCPVLALSVIMCSLYYFLERVLFHHDFHHDDCDNHWDIYGYSFHFQLHIWAFCNWVVLVLQMHNSLVFPPLDILLEHWIEHVTVGLLYVMFTFPTKIFYREVPGFATDCPFGIWCHGLTTGPLYYFRGWVGLWGFLWWAPSAKRKDHHGVSSRWSSVWHHSNTGLSSTQYEQIPIILGVWPFWLTPFFFRTITFWQAYG